MPNKGGKVPRNHKLDLHKIQITHVRSGRNRVTINMWRMSFFLEAVCVNNHSKLAYISEKDKDSGMKTYFVYTVKISKIN